MREKIKEILLENIHLKEEIIRTHIGEIIDIAKAIIACYKKGGKVIIFGNGGSAADSQHIAAELVGRFKKERHPLGAIALTTDTSILTALANDYGFDTVFLKQIESLAKKEDIAIGISTSGRAKNVLKAVAEAKRIGLKTVCFTGKNGGELSKTADFSIMIPSGITARIQEAHITVGHIICELIENALFS